ncbi:MAG: tetratricopeptide repeat protein [Luteolibacter sp.]
MKTRSVPLPVACLSFQLAIAAEPAPPAAPAAPPPAKLSPYAEGMAAVAAGDPKLAESCFTKALQQDPNNANARYQLGEVRKNASSIASKGRENKFGGVMIEKIQLDKATLQESLDYLASLVSKASKDQVASNFILEDPKNALGTKEVTLKLNNVPAKAVLQYILTQVDGRARFDEHAIVVSPRPGSAGS